MPIRKIEPRDAIEISVHKADICIKQASFYNEDQVIWVHRNDVPLLIEHLQAAYTEALDSAPEPGTDE